MRRDVPTRPDSGREASVEAASRVLELLHRTIQGLALYSLEHPSVRDSAEALSRRIASVVESCGVLRLGVAHDSFLIGAEELRSNGLHQLAETLNRLDVATVEIGAGCSAEEMLAMACLVCDAGRAALRGEALAKEIERATNGHVLIRALTFTGLSVREGSGAADGTGEGVEWGSLINSLVRDGGAHAMSAESVDRAVRSGCDEGARDFGLHLVRACDDTSRMEGAAGARGRERIHAFVRSLRSETRQRIVDSCLSQGAASGMGWAGAGDHADVPMGIAELFGAEEVLSSLDRLERAGVALSPETLKLFRRLSLLHPDPNDRDPGELPEDTELRDSVGELMGIRGKGEYSPTDYTSELEACVNAPHQPASRRWTLDRETVVLQKAEIALELLRDEKESDPGTDTIFRFLRDTLDRVIEARRIDLLSPAVRAAQHRAYQSVNAEGAAGPRELLAAIDTPERVTAILEAGGDPGSDCAELITLFREADFLLAHVPRILVDCSSTRVMRAGAEVLLGMSEAQLGPLIEALARMDLAALRVLLEVLIALPVSRVRALVEPLRDDDDARVRRLAYRALDSSGVALGADVLRRALGDEDAGVQRIALDHLRSHPDRGAIDTLSDYLRGSFTRRAVMWRSTCRRAACILADMEPGGEARLCEILTEGRWRMGRGNAARMREIADALSEREESVDASRALRRWSVSTPRLISALIGARLPEGGNG